MSVVSGIGEAGAVAAAREGERPKQEPQIPFGERVKGVLTETNRSLVEAESASAELARGEGDILETVMALSRAELSLRFLVSIRNRALEAYQEIMRLQVRNG